MPKTRRRHGVPKKPSRRRAWRPISATLYCDTCDDVTIASYTLDTHVEFERELKRGHLSCACGGTLYPQQMHSTAAEREAARQQIAKEETLEANYERTPAGLILLENSNGNV